MNKSVNKINCVLFPEDTTKYIPIILLHILLLLLLLYTYIYIYILFHIYFIYTIISLILLESNLHTIKVKDTKKWSKQYNLS